MSRVLFLTKVLPYPLSHGGALRVFHLSRVLAREHECFLATFGGQDTAALAELESKGIYRGILMLEPPSGFSSALRHFRRSESELNRLGRPEHYRHTIRKLEQFARESEIDVVIAVALHMSEYVKPLMGITRIVDDFDCNTLTLQRELAPVLNGKRNLRYLKSWLQLRRIMRQEARLSGTYDLVTTISPVDLEALKGLNAGSEKIHLLPNGVEDLSPDDSPPTETESNAVVFWGDLAFKPNVVAITHFIQKVYLPHLKSKGTRCYFIGRNPSADMLYYAGRYEDIHFPGFVEDLAGFIANIPVVINPMMIGSGLKNKVLEAMMMSKPVVTTSLGIEAIGAENNVHCLVADDPKAFAEATVRLMDDPGLRETLGAQAREMVKARFDWVTIGGKLSRLIEQASARRVAP
ncbi:MAG: glycosyltransferase family 4 protein [Gammaproteobacteria bacterium]|nr:glycosyltransferase family 4 protein [Gammaproteobacteria bacterium]